MSNTCFATYKIAGKKSSVVKLHNTIKQLDECEKPLVENEWYNPKLWLGCLVKALGGNLDDVCCRGTITDYEMEGDVLTVNTETAWTEMAETRHFVESCLPDIKIYYYEQEEGNGVFATNDVSGQFFNQRYYIDSSEGERYFATIDEVAEYVQQVIGQPIDANFDSIKDALETFADEHEDYDVRYDLHRIKVCDN